MAKITEIKNEKSGRYIWIDPWFVEVLCKYLHETMEVQGLTNYTAEMQEFYESIEFTAHGRSVLGIDGSGIYFEKELMEDSSSVSELISLISQTKNNIGALGDEVTVSMLNQHEADKFYDWQIISWSRPIKTSSLMNLLDIIILMLDETKPFELYNYQISFVGWEDIGGVGPKYV